MMPRSIAGLVACLLLVAAAAFAAGDEPDYLMRLDGLLTEGRPEAAVAAAREMLARGAVEAPHVWRVRQRLAVALLDLDRPREAVAELEAALAVAPDDAALHLNLGRALRRLGQRGRAIAEYGQAVDLAPDRFLWRLEYADALLDLGIHRDALREVRAARAACGDCPPALRSEVNVHQARGEIGAALEPLRLLYEQQPRPEVRRLLAGALQAAGDVAGMVALLDTVAVPELTGTELMLLIVGDRLLDRPERALDWVRDDRPALVDGWQPDHDFWAIAAEICLAAGHPEEALVAIDRALAIEPAVAVYHNNRAAILLELGRRAEAEAALAIARRLAGDDGGAR